MQVASYKEALDFLYNSLPMFQRQGAPAMKKTLKNIVELCAALSNPQDHFPSIHIAGTNGKGSTTHILSTLLQSQGKRVGVYTSPHYKDFRERIKINTSLMEKDFVISFLHDQEQLIEKIKPSFFEITVAMAFLYFSMKKVDIAIIEVGLGGRLDSTNILSPLVSVITNISKDHTQFLGNTLVEIAGEKAGIIKADTPVIIGEKQPEVVNVFLEKAKLEAAELSFAQDIWRCEKDASTNFVSMVSDQLKLSFEAPWYIDYQAHNLVSAFAAFTKWASIDKVQIDWSAVQVDMTMMPQKSYFLGRWMTLGESPKIVAESAHNEAGIDLLIKKLKGIKYDQLFMVLGFSDDKDLSSILDKFPKDAIYFWAKADIPRGMNSKKLQSVARSFQLHGRSYSSVKNALAAAKRRAGKHDFILVGGSIFVVAEVI